MIHMNLNYQNNFWVGLEMEYFVFPDYLLYIVATILLAGVILMPLVIVSKKW